MAWETFEATIEGLRAFPDLRRVVPGGYGEPLVHPHLPEMLSLASTLGVPELQARAALYLMRYNLLFVLPLVVVFVVAYLGTTSVVEYI